MGVLNITPNSFSDGGKFVSLEAALAQARAMAAAGAAIIDIGGESTRPGAPAVALQTELDRVLPVIEAVTRHLDVVVSIDTMKPEVMRAAIALGAGMVNDVRALQAPAAVAQVAASDAAVCLMHMQGTPRTMQVEPNYGDVVNEVESFLLARAHTCVAAGIDKDRIVLDPGFGFGKSVAHNLSLLKGLPKLCGMGFPVLVGLSRKSLLSKMLGRDVEHRLAGSLALATIAALRGASIVRCHDVAETCDAVAVAFAALQGDS
jgi:dihydropteroate synthase